MVSQIDLEPVVKDPLIKSGLLDAEKLIAVVDVSYGGGGYTSRYVQGNDGQFHPAQILLSVLPPGGQLRNYDVLSMYDGFLGFKGVSIRDTEDNEFGLFSRFQVNVVEQNITFPGRGYIMETDYYAEFLKGLVLGNLKGLLGFPHRLKRGRGGTLATLASLFERNYTVDLDKLKYFDDSHKSYYPEWAVVEEAVLARAQRNPRELSFATFSLGRSKDISVQGIPRDAITMWWESLNIIIGSRLRDALNLLAPPILRIGI
ncbi:MAG: hypothetical protein ACE5Q6_12575 [Dehalococcoidia bacterium]